MDGEVGVGELFCVALSEGCRSFVAFGAGEAVERELFEFDAEVVGGEIAEIVNGVALGASGGDAECSCLDGRAGHDEGWGFVMGEADGAGVGQVDVDGGVVGVVVDADVFVGAVVAADDAEVGGVEDELVVVGEGGQGILGVGEGWG